MPQRSLFAGRRFRPVLEELEARLAPAIFNVAAGDVAGLISAITLANTNPGPDTIVLGGGTYNFTQADNYCTVPTPCRPSPATSPSKATGPSCGG